jgi:hypothetical protein
MRSLEKRLSRVRQICGDLSGFGSVRAAVARLEPRFHQNLPFVSVYYWGCHALLKVWFTKTAGAPLARLEQARWRLRRVRHVARRERQKFVDVTGYFVHLSN